MVQIKKRIHRSAKKKEKEGRHWWHWGLIALLLFLSPPVSSHASETINARGLTGGASRALDFYSVNDISHNDRAIVTYTSGTSVYIGFYQYDSSGTTAENTSAHPFYVRPDDYSTSGVWVENPFAWVDIGAELTVDNLTVNVTLTTTNIESLGYVTASGILSGGVVYHGLTADLTISGNTLYGGFISGVSEPAGQSGITVTFPTSTGAGENVLIYNSDNTYDTGNTIYVHFDAADTIKSNQHITAGISKFTISGSSPWATRLMAVGSALNEWQVVTVGFPEVDWD